MQPYAWAHELLQTIPGIDKIAAALILIEIGDDMARFGRAESLANWAALSPGNNPSAGKRKSGRTGHGNAIIRFILCECANAARNTKRHCTSVEIVPTDLANSTNSRSTATSFANSFSPPNSDMVHASSEV